MLCITSQCIHENMWRHCISSFDQDMTFSKVKTKASDLAVITFCVKKTTVTVNLILT